MRAQPTAPVGSLACLLLVAAMILVASRIWERF